MAREILINGINLRFPASPSSEDKPNGCCFLESGACEECTCSVCQSGMIAWRDENLNLHSRECECRREARIRLRLKKSGLLERSRTNRLDTFVVTEDWQRTLLSSVQRYCERKEWRNGTGLFLSGQSGAGKSHLAIAASVYAAQHGATPHWLRWVQGGTPLKAVVNDTERYQEMIRPLLTAGLLLIDDLWKTEPTTADIRLAFELLDTRSSQRLPTIITSERTLAEIASFDGAVAGRIGEACRPYLLEINGSDKNYRFFKEDSP